MKLKLEPFIIWQKTVNWSRAAGVGFFLFVIIALYEMFFSLSHFLQDDQQSQIKHVTVLGDPKHTSEQQIIQAIRKADLSRFFDLNVNDIQKLVTELPWVETVSVRKQWPNTLKVYVVEHVPVAIWNDDLLLNSDGVVFQAPKVKLTKKLPNLFGPQGSEIEALNTFREFSELLYLNDFKLISLALSERFAWQFWLSNGINLNLGRKEKLQRVQRFIDLYPYMLKRKDAEVDSVDLRYDTGLAVSWKAADLQKLQYKNDNKKSKA
ncbi:cell division protein FtsQ/DivIB [Pseudoalteromonas denitrificans]|uniref:Cell division protein FtsQ n=1 Tax=Pseudoalteromonas denitrificans DSM 6059 TaxID=1123010 RepID=A0A1I1QTV6_9GAMM|nr:cell division protein FtsQ/DivIB [Pseudoalteromonas denitrificans]SFD23288.1 cell division protein FtsQ [Pseudoalteromonas denitrificans DSM 6059]